LLDINPIDLSQFNTNINKLTLDNEYLDNVKLNMGDMFQTSQCKLWCTMSDDITMDQLCPNSNQKSSANILLNDVYHSGYKDSI